MMLPIVLDTNAIRAAMDSHSERGVMVRQRIAEVGYALPSVVLYEVERGLQKEERERRGSPQRRDATRRFLLEGQHLPLDYSVAAVAADLWATGKLAKPAQNISEIDLLVAATALAYTRRLVTFDERLVTSLRLLEQGALLDDSIREP